MLLTQRELELRHFWRVMQDGIAAASLSEYRDELDLTATMTDWPRLRAACRKNMDRFDHLGSTILAANAR